MPDDLLTRVLPYNLEAERAVIGACLLDVDALSIASEALKSDDFYDQRHAAAFDMMLEMYQKGKAVDSVTFWEEISRRGLGERLGGQSFVAATMDAVTTTANALFYVDIVRDKAVHRQLIRAGNEIVRMGYAEDKEKETILEEAESLVYRIARTGGDSRMRPVKDLIVAVSDQIQERSRLAGGITGVPSGFADLDRVLAGFQPGSLNIVAARPSMGKTAFALNIAQHAAIREKIPVVVFSLEMAAEQLTMRLLSAESRVNLFDLQRSGKLERDHWNRLTEASAAISGAPLYIDDSSLLSPMDLRSRCRRFFAKSRAEGQNVGLVVVDYLQLMSASRKTDNRQQEVSDISRDLKGIAREFGVPVIALSQLSREVEKRGQDKRPQLSDLRDSGAIEQDADTVLFLYRESYYKEMADDDPQGSLAEVSVSKNRNGPTQKNIPLTFLREFARFESRARYNPAF